AEAPRRHQIALSRRIERDGETESVAARVRRVLARSGPHAARKMILTQQLHGLLAEYPHTVELAAVQEHLRKSQVVHGRRGQADGSEGNLVEARVHSGSRRFARLELPTLALLIVVDEARRAIRRNAVDRVLHS